MSLREIDRQIAEKVFHMKVVDVPFVPNQLPKDTYYLTDRAYEEFRKCYPMGIADCLPDYSRQIDLAWEVLEEVSKLADGHFTLFKFTTHYKAMVDTPDLHCTARRLEDSTFMKVADLPACPTAAQAICVAALDAIARLK